MNTFKKLILILLVIQAAACAPRNHVQPNTRIVTVECPVSLARAQSMGYSTNCALHSTQQ